MTLDFLNKRSIWDKVGKDVERVKILGQEYAALEEELREIMQSWERIAKRT